MKISVASGKGGTGKTTVALNLAISLPKVQLLDCDVEEPDCHLFLDTDLKVMKEIKSGLPIIDEEKCDHCGKCAELCQFNAIVVTPKDTIVFPELCHSCGLCMIACPLDAITESSRTIGVVEKGVDDIEFFQGVLTTGEPLAPPVIRAVKENIDPDKVAIIDVPPGNACPAVEAVDGTDFCILVTEPTPFGLHDLKFSVKMLNRLNIPFAVLINRVGIGDDRVEKYCEEEGIPILMKIPNSRRIAELYSEGIPFVREMPEWKDKFIDLYKSIEDMIK